MAKDTRWDRNLSVAPDADGLVGHAGAVLLRRCADQTGLTSALSGLWPRGRKGTVLVGPGSGPGRLAITIVLGGDVSVRYRVAGAISGPVFGAAPSDSTVHRAPGRSRRHAAARIAEGPGGGPRPGSGTCSPYAPVGSRG